MRGKSDRHAHQCPETPETFHLTTIRPLARIGGHWCWTSVSDSESNFSIPNVDSSRACRTIRYNRATKRVELDAKVRELLK
jgi:hypothetical protein